jgi:general secretion pathway protein G
MINNNVIQRRRAGGAARGGFTLVEILIVVVILGILAAIVVPQFASATQSSQTSSMESSLRTIRAQLEFYYAQHNSQYPTLAQINNEWNVLTLRTDIDGDTGTTDGVHVFGPYIKQMPSNPFENSRDVAAAPAAGVGWVYNATTGRVYGVMLEAKATELDVDAVNTVLTYP